MLYLSDAAVWFLEVLPTFIYPLFATLFWIFQIQNRAYNNLIAPPHFGGHLVLTNPTKNTLVRTAPFFRRLPVSPVEEKKN